MHIQTASAPADHDDINQDIYDDGHGYVRVADLLRPDRPFTMRQRVRHKRRGLTGTVISVRPPAEAGREWHVCMAFGGGGRYAGPASSFEAVPSPS